MKTILRELKKDKITLSVCVLFLITVISVYAAITSGRDSHEIAITPYRGNTQFVSENIQTVSSTANGDIVITTTDGEKFIFTN